MTHRIVACCVVCLMVLAVPYGQTTGERLAAQKAEIDSHEKTLSALNDIPERTAALETEVRVIRGLAVSLNAIGIGLIGIVWYASKKLRRTYHNIAGFMGMIREVPELKKLVLELPCRRGMTQALEECPEET